MDDLVYVTSNQEKFKEAKELFPSMTREPVDITEVQGSPEDIVVDKARKAYQAVGEPCVVDDACLMIDALGGSPGPYVKDFLKGLSCEEIGALFSGSRAEAVLFLCYKDAETTKVFRSSVHGSVVLPRGDGWGYEPVFEPDEYDQTWAELDVDEIKHRAKALKRVREWLT